MRKVGPAVALLATTAVALTAHAPSVVHAAKSNPGGRGRRDNQIHFIPAIPSVFPDESVNEDVARLQRMSDRDVKNELRKLYSVKMDVQPFFPSGSLDAMQRVSNAKDSRDERQRELNAVLNRYALLLGRMLHGYIDFYDLQGTLKDPSTKPDEYKKEVAKLDSLASICATQSRLIVAYLRRALEGLRAKFGQSAKESPLREVLGFVGQLPALYEAEQTLFHLDVEMAKMRFTRYADRAVDLSVLKKERAYKQAENQQQAATAEYQRRSNQARASAASSVRNGILSSDYLTLLPFAAPGAH
ncbi:hypothetical protein Emag_006544 [Eimeria magna]